MVTAPETTVRLGMRIRSSRNYSGWLSGVSKLRRKAKQGLTTGTAGRTQPLNIW